MDKSFWARRRVLAEGGINCGECRCAARLSPGSANPCASRSVVTRCVRYGFPLYFFARTQLSGDVGSRFRASGVLCARSRWSREQGMAICSECGADIDVDEFDVDRGDQLSCSECGANLVVFGLSPITLELADEEAAGDLDEPADEDEDRAGDGD